MCIYLVAQSIKYWFTMWTKAYVNDTILKMDWKYINGAYRDWILGLCLHQLPKAQPTKLKCWN